MGSSHSYLQNLQAGGSKTMYKVSDNFCYEYLVADVYTKIASELGSTVGTCASKGFTIEGFTYNSKGSYMGHAYNAVVTKYSMGGLQELYQSENLVHWVI